MGTGSINPSSSGASGVGTAGDTHGGNVGTGIGTGLGSQGSPGSPYEHIARLALQRAQRFWPRQRPVERGQ
jgi:hypothetical protein